MTVDGTIDELQFANGTSDRPLRAPRGMFVQADTLWAADVDGVHGFDRRTGDHYGRVVVASQADSSLHVIGDGATRQIVQVVGRPADIGVDVQRHRVAVPYISLNQVDIWQLPNR